MIEDTRLITDLKTTAVRIKLRGAILISNIERAKYRITTLRKIIPSINEVPDETIIWRERNFWYGWSKLSETKRMMISTAKSLLSYFCTSCTKELR
jgi:hypothetical protein